MTGSKFSANKAVRRICVAYYVILVFFAVYVENTVVQRTYPSQSGKSSGSVGQAYTVRHSNSNNVGGSGVRSYFKSSAPKRYFTCRAKPANSKYRRDIRFKSANTEDFYELVIHCRAVIDKSLLIEDLLLPLPSRKKKNGTGSTGANKVMVWTAPRGYGKTLYMDMVKRFLEIEVDEEGKPLPLRSLVNPRIFVGGSIRNGVSRFPIRLKSLKIVRDVQSMKYRGKFPVIRVSFKHVRGNTFDEIRRSVNDHIRELLLTKYAYLKKSIRKKYYQMHNKTGGVGSTNLKTKSVGSTNPKTNAIPPEYGLRFLCHLLRRHHKRKVIVLIDEYDSPVINAYLQFDVSPSASSSINATTEFRKVFDLFNDVLKNLIENNDHLARLVLSGIVPIRYPALKDPHRHRGINNQAGLFGFTQYEVDYLLNKGGINKRTDEIKSWFYGFNASGIDLYVPSLLMKCLQHCGKLGPRWTANQEKWFVQHALQSDELQETVQNLVGSGRSVRFQPRVDLDENGLSSSKRHLLLSLLAFSGYLIPTGAGSVNKSDQQRFNVPNEEARYVFTNGILSWLCGKLKITPSAYFVLAGLLSTGKTDDIERFKVKLQKILSSPRQSNGSSMASDNDGWRTLYKGFALSLKFVLSLTYSPPGKRYTGGESTPLVMLPKTTPEGDHVHHNALMFDYRVTNSTEQMESAARTCLETIGDKRYHGKLRSFGTKNVTRVCLAFYQQNSMVEYRTASLISTART